MSGETNELIALTVALLLSAFFSGSETAYTTAGRLAMEVYARHRRFGSRSARFLYDRPRLLFSTTLVGNNLVGVAYSSLAALVLTRFGLQISWVVAISSVVVLLFGEILPKSIAREAPERWAMQAGLTLRTSYWILSPLILIAQASSNLLLLLLGMGGEEGRAASLSVSELRGIWQDMQRGGALDADEVRLLDQAVSLRDKKIGELMVPRTSLAGIPIETTVEEAIKVVNARGFSRIPVFEGDLDHIVGILHAKRFLENPSTLADILLPALFVPEQTSVPKFLAIARENDAGLAVVIDEHGGTAGLITLEDVVEEIVGDIEDEYDRRSESVRKVSEDVLLVHGLTELDDLEERFKVDLPQGEYETIGGLMIERLGDIPQLGETLNIGKWTLRVVAADKNRVKRVLIRKIARGR